MAASSDPRRYDVGIIGAGSAAETLVGELGETDMSLVVFEPNLVGGECPFHACMPSKSMLRDASTSTDWADAIARRQRITSQRDDGGHDDGEHASGLAEHGADLIRARAEIVGPGRVRAADVDFELDHVVIATGADPIVPPIDGADRCGAAIWTSADAYTSTELPRSLVIVGAGVIGMETASLYSSFGCDVTLVDRGERPFSDAPVAVSEILLDALDRRGVELRTSVEATAIRRSDSQSASATDDPSVSQVTLTLSDGSEIDAERVLVAIGRRPALERLGVDAIGLDPDAPLPLEPNGQLRCDGSVWAIGDVAGKGQYTHLANHQARVVADHLAGASTRRFDDVVVPRCMFTDPPLIQVGPSWLELRDDRDVVSVGFDLDSFPRSITDDLPPGHLWVAARRSSGCVVAATGIGPSFDELTHALVTAIDGAVPVARLRLSMQAFPTIGEILGPIYAELHAALTSTN